MPKKKPDQIKKRAKPVRKSKKADKPKPTGPVDGRKGNGFSPEDQARMKKEFIKELPNHGAMIYSTAETIGTTGTTIKAWMKKDPDFAQLVMHEEEKILDKIERVAQTRAVGYEENVWYKGKIVGTDHKVSEKMAALILTSKRGYTNRTAINDETEENRLKKIRKMSEEMSEEQLAQGFMDDISAE